MYLRRPLCAFCLLFALCLSIVMRCSGSEERDSTGQSRHEGERVTFTGRIRSMEDKDNRLILQIENTSISDKNLLLYLKGNDPVRNKLHIGSIIKAEGLRAEFNTALNRGQLDLKEYYAGKNIGFPVYNGTVIAAGTSYAPIRDRLYRLKENTASVFKKHFDAGQYGIIKALVLADRTDLDAEVKERYSNAGISHILALSGLHIATVGFIIYGALRKLGAGGFVSCIISSVIIALYCVMVGMPVSAVRALIMFFLSMGALLIGRTADLRTCAAVAAVIMLAANPARIYDSSFLLSFSAVIGIGLIYPGFRFIMMTVLGKNRIRQLHRSDRLPVRACMAVLRTLLFSASIQIAMLPFTMWFYYQLPLYGIFVNLAAVPLAGFLLLSSALVGILGNISLCLGSPLLLETVIRLPAYAAGTILRVYDVLIRAEETLPGSVLITGRPEEWQMWMYGIILAFVMAGSFMLEKKEREGRIKGKSDRAGRFPEKRLKRYSAALLLLCLFSVGFLFVRIRPRFELSSLYVGQGQCFVMHGRDIPTVIYDCGSSDESEAGRYMVEPFLKYSGISFIDTVFISHLDRDHVSALIELLNDENSGIWIRRIIIPCSASQKGSENYPMLLKAASGRKVPVYSMKAGDRVEWKRLGVECISPFKGNELTDMDINDGSLVLSVLYQRDRGSGFRALFTGDISSEVEEGLIKNGVEKHDYLQVAHHGSRSSANDGFLKRVSPIAAVISAGIDNKYGHPHAETLDMLDRIGGVSTFVTSCDGEVDTLVDLTRGQIRFIMVSEDTL